MPRFRHKLTFRQKTRTADDQGGYSTTWNDWKTRYGEIREIMAREARTAGQYAEVATHFVYARAITGLTSQHRIDHDGRTFHILGIRHTDRRRQWLELLCQELQ
jgi:SPP1 family predicted phage head-tail adaptor